MSVKKGRYIKKKKKVLRQLLHPVHLQPEYSLVAGLQSTVSVLLYLVHMMLTGRNLIGGFVL